MRASVQTPLPFPPFHWPIAWIDLPPRRLRGLGLAGGGLRGFLSQAGVDTETGKVTHPGLQLVHIEVPPEERRKGRVRRRRKLGGEGVKGGRQAGGGGKREGDKGDSLGDLVLVQLRDVLDREAAARTLVHLRREARKEGGEEEVRAVDFGWDKGS